MLGNRLRVAAITALSSMAVWSSEARADADPPVVQKGRTYTLEDCLAMADRNHPAIWAARARLANVHAQLNEIKWIPFTQFGANSTFGVLPSIGGTPFYNGTPFTSLNTSFTDGLQPTFSASIWGILPIYTFGKIDAANAAAKANVRLNEWDLEKARVNVRADLRRAFFGLMLARDAKEIIEDALSRLDKGIEGIVKKLEKGDNSVEESDRLRLEIYREEVAARLGEVKRGEAFALSALKFFTGQQDGFDIPDEPLKRPEAPLGPVVRYLTAARLFRPDVNLARSGIVIRKAQVDLARARLFPDFGIAANAGYSIAPGVVQQQSAWIPDPFNRFGYGAQLGLRWNLDLLPGIARVEQAEAQLEEARSLERLALGGVAVEVENAYGAVIEARTREESWDKAEHRARRWILQIQDAIDLGAKDERALSEPIRVFLNARAEHARALMDYNVALGELARITGWDQSAPGAR